MRSLRKVLCHHSDAEGELPKRTMNDKDGEKFPFKASRFILLIGFVGYCLMGAKIFQALETDAQEELKNTFLAVRQDLMDNYASISPQELEIFLQMLTFSVKNGIVPIINGTTYITWSLKNSFAFVASTLSTIGYGSIAPKTPMGQIFCVFYALLGIPLTIIFLKSVGNAILQPFLGLEKYLQNMGMKEGQIKICTFLFFLVTGLVIFIFLPSLIFMYTEDWSYNEGLYFAFISLSTIGFGDYVPGVNPSKTYSQIYTAFIIVWCTFGLTWIALLFTLFSKLLEITKTKLTCNVLCQTNKTSPVPSILYLWPSLEQEEKRESQISFVNSEMRRSNRE